MSNRPHPPLSTDSPEELAHHVAEHASDWMMYLRNLNQYTSTLEEEVSSSQVETLSRNATIASLRSDLTKRDGVISYQKDQYDAAQKEVIRLEIEKLQLLNAATPAVQTPATEPAPTGPRVDRTADAAPGATLPTPVTSTGSAILSEKLPDPKEFDGSRHDLRRFTQQIYAKMTANADRFPTATARLTYVAGRLTEKAYELILPKTLYGVPQFVDYPDLLKYLEEAFGDPDRIQNSRNKLYQLRQRNQDFSTYFAEFQRLALEGEMPETALSPLLFQGISRELQDMLLHNPADSDEFRPYARHLQSLDNRFRQHQQQVSRHKPVSTPAQTASKTYATAIKPAAASTQRPPAPPLPAGDPMDLSSQRRSNGRKERRECYRCGSSDHFVAQCHLPDNRPPRVQGFRPSSPASRSPLRSPVHSTPRSPTRGRSNSPAQSSINGASLR